MKIFNKSFLFTYLPVLILFLLSAFTGAYLLFCGQCVLWLRWLLFLFALLLQISALLYLNAGLKRYNIKLRNTLDLLKCTRENALEITADDALDGMPVDPQALVDMQECIRNVMNLASTEELMRNQMQLSILQSQINPHFLYNTLDSIRGQAEIDGYSELADIIESLSVFFRYSISIKKDYVSIEDELKNVTNYIKIQQFRFENRFTFSIVCDDLENLYRYMIPKLTLQPLLENAIYHAFNQTADTGKITITITETQDRINITVSDNGIGMSEQQVIQLNKQLHDNNSNPLHSFSGRSNGLALKNVNDRIKLLFGNEYGLVIYSAPNLGTDIELSISKRKQEDIERETMP